MSVELEIPDLENASVSNKEMNPFAYDPSEYPSLQDMLSSHEFNSTELTTIDIQSLSVNGQLLKDSMDEYLKKKNLGSSTIKEVLKTPLHYKFKTEMKEVPKDDSHFKLGTFAHLAFMEPEKFKNFIIEPVASMASIDGVTSLIRFYEKTNKVEISALGQLGNAKIGELKNYLSTLKEQCPYPVVAKEYQEIIDWLQFQYKHYGGGIIPRILKGAASEVSFYGKDPSTGIPVKVRPDMFNISENIGVDAIISFKTTSAQDVRKFFYDAAKYQYELSEGMYQKVVSDITGRKFNTTIMIMLQTVAPYLPAVFWWNAEDIANGKYKYRYAMDTIKECQDKTNWPGFDALSEYGNCGIIDMTLPEWSKREIHPVDIED